MEQIISVNTGHEIKIVEESSKYGKSTVMYIKKNGENNIVRIKEDGRMWVDLNVHDDVNEHVKIKKSTKKLKSKFGPFNVKTTELETSSVSVELNRFSR